MNVNRDLASIWKIVVPILAIYLYFAGWVYAYYYFQHFGISLISVDIPLYYFFVYSYSALDKWIYVLLSLILLCNYLYKLTDYMTIIVPILLIICFPLVFYQSQNNAYINAINLRQNSGKRIKIIFEKKGLVNNFIDPCSFENFSSLNNNHKLKFITSSKESYYVMYQPIPMENSSELPRACVYKIEAKDTVLTVIPLQNAPKKVK